MERPKFDLSTFVFSREALQSILFSVPETAEIKYSTSRIIYKIGFLALLGTLWSSTAAISATSTWIAATNKTWAASGAWSTSTAPGAADTAVFVTGGGAGDAQVNVLAGSGGITVANILDGDTNGPVFYTPATAGTYLLTVTGTFDDTAIAGSTNIRNNGSGLLNFAGNVVENTGGGNLEFGFNGASNPLNAYSANQTIVTGSSLTGFNVTGTAFLGDVTVGSSGNLDLQDSTAAGSSGVVSATSLSGSGSGIIQVSSNAVTTNTATLILTDSGTTAVYYGVIRDGPSGDQNQLSVIMNGNGTQVLVGNNTYSGTTQILNGTLQLGDGVTGSGNLAVNSSVVLSPTGTLAFANVGSQNSQSSISGTGSVAVLTGTTVFLAGTRTYGGTTSITGGATLQVGSFGTVGTLSGSSAILNNGTLSFAKTNTLAYGNVISGTGGVQQLGTGTTVLSGANTYTGATLVAAGSLLISGSLSSATNVTVDTGAALGIGQAAGALVYGTLNITSLTTGVGSGESIIDLNLGSSGNDSITTGALTLNGEPIDLVLTGSGSLAGSYTLLTWTSGGLTDVGTQIDLAGSSAGITSNELSISGDSLVLTVAAVPEPSPLALLGGGLLFLVVLRQRRRAAARA